MSFSRIRGLLALTFAASLATAPAFAESNPVAAKEAVLLRDPGGWLHAFTAGRSPEESHPRGTLIVAYSGKGSAFVAEVDLATLATIGRTQVASENARLHFAQEGAHTYALIDTDAAHRFVEIGSGLAITPIAKLAATYDRTLAFIVVNGCPLVLPDSTPAKALLFARTGKLTTKRNCKGGFFEGRGYDLQLREGRVFLTGLVFEDSDESVCAFDENGKGPVDVLRVREGQSFELDPVMQLFGNDDDGDGWVASVDRRLRVHAKKPYLHKESGTSPPCPGIHGTVRRQTATIHGIAVVYTVNCCGGKGLSGIWVCPK